MGSKPQTFDNALLIRFVEKLVQSLEQVEKLVVKYKAD
jgi:hypothetical protein